MCGFERWPLVADLPAEPTSDEVLAAYADHVGLCAAGDSLSVPANTTHWFDMGTRFPDFDTLTSAR